MEEGGQHRAHPVDGDTGAGQPVGQRGRDQLQPLVGAGLAQQLERGQTGRHRQRISRQACPPGTRRPWAPAGSITSAAAAERRGREAAADDLAQAGEVGAYRQPLLGAAVGNPETGDHLVGDQQRSGAVADRPQALQEAGLRRGRRPCSRRPARRSRRPAGRRAAPPAARAASRSLYWHNSVSAVTDAGHARSGRDRERGQARAGLRRAAHRRARGSRRRT